ncbi:MAG TPA: M67 family metallopeptidase [Allosphingosinicella sp.]
MRWRISRALLARLQAEARAAGGRETCGLLVGGDGLIREAVSAPNVAPDPAIAFEIDPGLYLRTQRAARDRGLRILGHYHSHPGGDPRPSVHDAARAEQVGVLWLILAGNEAALWTAGREGLHGRFVSTPFEIVGEPPCKDAGERPIGGA